MTSPFPKTDLARLVQLPLQARVLGLLAALRFIAADDLCVVGVDADAVTKLVADGLVFSFRLQRRLTEEKPTQVLALRRNGARELARVLDVDQHTVSYSTKSTLDRSAMFLDHQLAVGRFAVLLARALSATTAPARLLSWETDPDRLADAVLLVRDLRSFRRQPLVADALAVVQGPRGAEGLLVEIDRGTERPGYLGKKYAGYLAWWKDGGPLRRFDVKALRLMTIAPDEKRAERLREAGKDATAGRLSGLFWFAAEDRLVHDGLLAPVWSTLRSDQLALWS